MKDAPTTQQSDPNVEQSTDDLQARRRAEMLEALKSRRRDRKAVPLEVTISIPPADPRSLRWWHTAAARALHELMNLMDAYPASAIEYVVTHARTSTITATTTVRPIKAIDRG